MNVIVLLSGGIDSMACVEFYMEQGDAVEGLFFEKNSWYCKVTSPVYWTHTCL